MDRPGEPQVPPPPAPAVEYCYRHPTVATMVHCTRCGRPICPECMIPAPVGHQCPECVQQARREFRQGPGRRVAVRSVTATKVLLVAIIAVFVLELVLAGAQSLGRGASGQRLVDLGAMYPPAIAFGEQWWRLFTAMFLHAGLFHILFNAWALWVFGTVVERDFGTARFVAIFFISGFVASAASYAFGPVNVPSVGASGAIFGVFGAFVAYNYRRRHLAMAAQNLRFAMTLILINAALAFMWGAIDWRAHVGGFVAGAIAGMAAEGLPNHAHRTAATVAGFAGLLVVGIALVMWRTADLRSMFGL
ncbi:MAG TPA: rhomboid family intramembrane serine protease [Actinomycetota bacterium]|nr:rhomboid family intramembrane serine protease [Actinomycetota bacterium]